MGFTTFIQIFILDCCMFNSNIQAGVIAHNREDAEDFFTRKIRFAYEHMEPDIRNANPAIAASARHLVFANGSSIRVGTSLRSGTYQLLHISEYGKLCAKYPDRAEEVRSGAMNTVPRFIVGGSGSVRSKPPSAPSRVVPSATSLPRESLFP